MTDLGFPNNPALNELFTSGWSTWMFDGVKWQASVPSGGVYEPVFGGRQFPMYGFLYQETAGDPGYSDWAGFGAHRWRFGVSPGDDFAAGSIDYRGYVSDALSIVGAGATAGTRKINLYDNVNVSGNLTVGTTTILGGGGGIVSVGNITATGPLTISGPMGTTGSNAILTFQDRTGTTNWGWYAQAGVARLWNDQSGDRVTIDGGGSITTPGNVRAGGNLYLGGPYVLFSGVTAGGPFIYANATDMVAQLGTGNGTFYWMNNPGAEVMRLDSTGKLVAHNEIHSQGPFASLWFQDRGGAFDWCWYSDSNQAHLYNTYGGVGRVVISVDWNGTVNTIGNVNPGFGAGAGDAAIELGLNRTDSGNAYIDFHAQPGTDFDFRIQRFPGATGATHLINNGGAIELFSGQGGVYFHGIDGRDALVVYRSAGAAYLTIVPEYGTNQALIGYYIPNVGWGSLNLAGSVTLGAVNTGDIHCNNVFTSNYICMAGNTDGGHGPTIYADASNFVFKLGPNNGTYYFANLNGSGVAGIDGAGNLFANGQVTASGPFLKKGGGPSYRISPQVDNTGIGSMWYTDPSNFYLLLTATNDAWGTWNGLRPFMVTLSNGNVTLGHRVDVTGGLYANAGIMVTGGFTSQSGSDFNGYVNVNNGNNLGVSGNVTAYGGQIVCYNSNGNGFHCQNANGQWVHMFDDGNGHIECTTQLWLNWNTGQAIGIGTGGIANCGNIVMNNASLLYGRDTAGNAQWLISLWSDNTIYVGDNSRPLYLRGSVNVFNNQIQCPTITVGGLLWQNYNGGWWWTGSPIHTDSEMACSAITAGGHRIYDSGGWEYHDAGIHANQLYSRNDSWCANNMTAGGSMQANGTGWSLYAPNGGIYSPNEIHGGLVTSGGDIRLGGSVTCSGWYYGGGNGGAQIRCWAGDWGAMSYAMSGGYFEVSPDQGASGYVLQPISAWSDARLKTGIRDSEVDALAVLGAIPIRAFEWTERGQRFMPGAGPVSCGLVAQEIKELIPNAVAAVGLLGGGMLRIVSDHLDAYYIRAFQQLAARVEELEDLVRNQRSLT
jgi:hypothetical protein